jgi:two-component system sensor histidine kinase HydH
LFEELKRYVGFSPEDEQALLSLHAVTREHFSRIAEVFYARILEHEGARTALEGGESQVGHLKGTLEIWMDQLLCGPWDEAYYDLRCRIGRMHVRIALPQHYMFGAMNVLRNELVQVADRAFADRPTDSRDVRLSLHKILDLELAIMLHTYREDLLTREARHERLATFGQLVGTIGHELRNPLGVIESSLYLLRSRATDERAIKHVGRIEEQVSIANQIITDLLDLIRDRPLTMTRVRPRELVDSALAMVRRPANVTISMEGVDDLPELEVDGSKLRQVLVNLVANAVDALEATGGGQVRVTGVLHEDGVLLAVEDTGPGVDPAIRDRLFEPLISTKSKGIGLGLPFVRRVVERHGGKVSYEPGPSGGARFVVRLPGERRR